jgi:nucleoside-diphosphate-sugar epimerase
VTKLKILCTGSSGYIGSELVKHLLASDVYSVRAFDVVPYSRFAFRSLEMVVGDLLDEGLLAKVLKDVDVVVHLASVVGRCENYPAKAETVNVEGTRRLFDLAKESGVKRFLFASTTALYGTFRLTMSNESSPVHATDKYTETKLLAERYLQSTCTQGTKVTVMRFANAYGGTRKLRDYHLNGFVFQAMINGGRLEIRSPQSVRPMIHVSDLVHGIAKVLEASQTLENFTIMNIGDTKQNYTKLQLAEAIAEIVPLELTVKEGHDERNYPTSFFKLRMMGFKAEKTLKDGVFDALSYMANIENR